MRDVKFILSAIDKTAAAFNSVKAGLMDVKKSAGGVQSFFGGMKGAIAAALGGAAFKSLADTADHINDLSNRLGIGAEVLSQYAHIANMSGVEFNTLAGGLQKLGKNVSEAAHGTGAAKDALMELGIDAKKLSQLGIDQQFEVIAQAMQGVTNDGDKVRLAMDLFGKSGAELIPAMEGGAQAIQGMRKEADALGMTMTQAEVGAIAGMNDAFDKLIGTITALGTKIVAFFAPALEWIADFLTNAIVKAVELAKAAFQGMIAFFLKVSKAIVDGIAYLIEKIGALPGLLSDALGAASNLPMIGDSFNSASQSVGNLEKNIKGFAASMRESVDVLGYVKVESESVTEGQKKLAQSFEATNKAIGTVTNGTEKLKQSLKETAEAQEHLKQLQSEAKSVFESTRTPLEKFNAEVKKLDELRDKKLIDMDTYNRAILQAREGLETFREDANQTFDVIKDKGREAAGGLIDTFADAAFGIGDGFKGLKQSFSQTFKELNADILKNTLKNFFLGDGQKKGGILDGLFGNNKQPPGGFVGPMQPGAAANNNNPMGFGKDAGTSLADSFTANTQGFFSGLKDIFTGNGGFLSGLGEIFKGATSSFSGIFSSLGSSLSGMLSGIGGGISSLFGGASGGMGGLLSMGMSLFGGFFADGGTVRAGKAHVVGERGPELFIPNRVGSIIPNDAMNGGGAVSITMNINTPDIASFRKSQGQIVGDMARQISKAKRNL